MFYDIRLVLLSRLTAQMNVTLDTCATVLANQTQGGVLWAVERTDIMGQTARGGDG